METIKSQSLVLTLLCLTVGFSGCSVGDKNSSVQPREKSIIYQENERTVHNEGYMYNRANNLEYMDTRSIEKLKKAVSILIDKVEGMDGKYTAKEEQERALNGELKYLKQEVSSLKQTQMQPQDAKKIDVAPNTPLSPDDIKILEFIEQKK